MLLPAIIVFRWSTPRPAPLGEMPPLLLSPTAVSAQLEVDAERAAAHPTGPIAEERLTAYQESSEAEVLRRDSPQRAAARRERLLAATLALREEAGLAAVLAAREHDLSAMEPALRGQVSAEDAMHVLGGFTEQLERYQMTVAGIQVAPRFVVRTAFKARWNGMHGREPTEDLGAEELKAYWGWLALRATGAPYPMRNAALERYGELGGAAVPEARAMLLEEAGLHAEAADAFMAAYTETPSFRLRNYALTLEGELEQ